MQIKGYENEYTILKELGTRISQYRIALNITQADIAKKSGIAISTVQRLENGEDTKVSNYIKIMAQLGILENFNMLIPEQELDFKAIYEERKIRQRARKTGNEKKEWIWGEDKK